MLNKLKVTIGGLDYTLVSEDSPEYMQKLTDFVNMKLKEAQDRNKTLGVSKAAILAALNIADEMEGIKKAAREKVDSQAAEILSLKQRLEQAEKRSGANAKPFPNKNGNN